MWEVLGERVVLDRPWLRVREQSVRTSRGACIPEFHLIDAVDWACIVCITNEQQLVLVRQYRHGVGRVTLELPAGALDVNEEPLSAAKRELLEETGYEAAHWQLLRVLAPETTRHSHRAHLYLATGARRIAEQRLDPTEDVQVVLAPWGQSVIEQVDHGIHLAACLLAQQKA